MSASPATPRAGRLDCLCEPIEAAGNTQDYGDTALLRAAFALSVLSQVLTLTILPLAGLSLAPSGSWATLPYCRIHRLRAGSTPVQGWRCILWPSLIGALGCFAMTALMGATPIAMIGCGLGEVVSGIVAWHVIAMYAPSLALAGLPKMIRPAWIAFGGCTLIAVAIVIFLSATTAAAFAVSTAVLGISWPMGAMGTTLWVHEGEEPSRWLLGLHDGMLLGSALLGALAAGMMH